MPGLISGILEGYTLGSAISKDAQERQADLALQDAYKGMTPEQAADPQASMKALMTAGTSLAKRGQGKAGYEMMKQASTLETASMQQNIAKMTQFQGGLELAGQVAQGANSYEDLVPALQHLEKVMPPDQLMGIVAEVKQAEQKGIPFADAKKHMLERGMTVSQNLNQELKASKQQLAVMEEQRKLDKDKFEREFKTKEQARKQENFLTTETRRADTALSTEQDKQKRQALSNIKQAVSTALPPKYEDYVTAYGKAYADKLVEEGYTLEREPKAAPTKEATAAAKQGAAEDTVKPTGSFLEQRAAGVETRGSKDPYAEVNPKSGATGKYQFVKGTWEGIRKQDSSLPTFDKLAGDKAAQEKGAKILEAQISDEIKNAGFKVTNANKDMWWRFGDSDAKKIKAAFEDNPKTPVANVVSKQVMEQNPDLRGKSVAQAIEGNVSAPAPVTETSAPTFKQLISKAATGLPAERAARTLENTMQTVKDVSNVSKLPAGTVLGTFAGMTGQDQKGIISSLSSLAARTVTDKDSRAMEQLVAGLESALATAVGGGYASAASESKMKQIAKEIPRIGDDGAAAARWMARVRQQLETVADGYMTSQAANLDQKKQMKATIEELKKAVPFTIEDVLQAEKGKSKKATMGEEAAKLAAPVTRFSKSKASSEDSDLIKKYLSSGN
jgi:hypothetical protein